jgi:hypothetical protein
MIKTLIGKENYLFLQNDTNNELEVHHNNIDLVSKDFYLKYEAVKSKFLLIIFPNKCYIQNKFLPEPFDLKYRPSFEKYNEYLKEHILDGYLFLKDKIDHYYKTDTHINLKGSYLIYENFIDKINKVFNLNIEKKNINIEETFCPDGLSILGKGIGDLTWDLNLGNQIITSKSDVYYYSKEIKYLYCTYIINSHSEIRLLDYNLDDVTNEHVNKTLDWHLISKYILYKKNIVNNKFKILIFYDSFLLNSLDLYINMFDEVYLCKTLLNATLINLINPDYIFEFRCERFLS